MVKRQFKKGAEGKMKKTICSILAAIMCLSLCACGNAQERKELDRQARVAAFVDYLETSSDKNSVTRNDYSYGYILSTAIDADNTIHIHFDYHELSYLNVTINIGIPVKKGDATFSAEGKVTMDSTKIVHQANGIWSIADYNKDKNAIIWGKSNCVANDESLDIHFTDLESMFTAENETLTSSYLDIITTYISSILEKSETGATMADIGFLSY